MIYVELEDGHGNTVEMVEVDTPVEAERVVREMAEKLVVWDDSRYDGPDAFQPGVLRWYADAPKTEAPKPTVVIIEHPDLDPDYYAVGDVEVIYTSSYPTTYYAADDRRDGEYDDYAAGKRQLADDLDALPGGADAAAALRRLADDYDQAAEADDQT